ncbi:MAG: GTP-binding protein [Gemmatimonadetes bacterium]|nr:GTP-binding protein [Gemmatimonadota bacterium]
MIKKKIAMLGAHGVGKTSLVQRFVKSIFSDKYLSTVGVKIDKKAVDVDGVEVELLLWDIAGEEERFAVPLSYLRGTAGFLLVMDGTRADTLATALDLHQRTVQEVGEVPFVVAVNKSDLVDAWEIDEGALEALRGKGWTIFKSSAKLGTGVEEAFLTVARGMVAPR